ncbi:hypothetical protein, partial [Bacillus mobilis]|uniref:hypothetical protein n=2 Tax=Bacillati TaxID=1783272 RepID=UPI0036411B21
RNSYQPIADAMVKNNEVPAFEKVATRHQSRKDAWLRRNAVTAPVDLSEPVVDTLLAVIARSWKARGHGPSWGEAPVVGAAAGQGAN